MDVKNTLEVLEALKVAAVAVKEISKDGIKIDDLPKALELLKNFKVFTVAVEGVGEFGSEFKDIDSAEAVVIVSKLMEALKAVKEA